MYICEKVQGWRIPWKFNTNYSHYWVAKYVLVDHGVVNVKVVTHCVFTLYNRKTFALETFHVCKYMVCTWCKYICMYTHTGACVYVCMCERMCVCLYECMHVCICVCMYVYMYVTYVHMYGGISCLSLLFYFCRANKISILSLPACSRSGEYLLPPVTIRNGWYTIYCQQNQ